MNEKQFIEKIKKIYDSHYIYKTVGGYYNKRGAPDLLIDPQIAIEAKIYPNKSTKLQLEELKKIARAGGKAYIYTYSNKNKGYKIEEIK